MNTASVSCFGFLVLRSAGYQLPDLGLNPHPLQWNCGVSTMGLPGSYLCYILDVKIVK